MKKYSTLLLSSTLLLTALTSSPLVLAEDAENTIKQEAPVDNHVESASAATLQQALTTQQNGKTLSIYYQRSAAQTASKIQYAIRAADSKPEEAKWYDASDYQTDISLEDYSAGQYSIQSYIFVDDKPVLLEESSFTISEAQPTITTHISETGVLDVTVHNVPQSAQLVHLPIWSNENGQDDLKWYAATRQADGTYTLRVYLKQHKFNTGTYSIHMYTQDTPQSKLTYITQIETQVAPEDIPSNTAPQIAIEQLQAQKGSYQVTVQETAYSKTIQSVQVATWSTDRQTNIKWRSATLQNGKYQVAVDFKEHQNHTGHYQNHVYINYTDGSRVGYVADTVDLTSARLPLQFTSQSAGAGTIQVTFSNIYDTGNISYAVWSDENGQDDIKWYSASKTADKTYSGNISLANHKGTGKYHVHVYQGKGLGAFTVTVTAAQRATTPNTYPIGECTWGAKEVAPWAGNYWGNGGNWTASARAAGFKTGNTPRVGAIAVWTDGGYGHVAVVTAVESHTRIRVKESNYAGRRYVGDFRGWFNPVADGVTAYIYPN